MRKLIDPFLLVLMVLMVFHSWFTPGLLISYDFPFYSRLMMKDASFRLYAWNWHIGFDGFAGFFSPYSWVFPFIYIPQVIFGKYLGMDWAFIERMVYLYPLLILLIFSPIFLINNIDPRLCGNDKREKRISYLISVLIFSFNTYSLLLAEGEIFVALAYALIPLIFALFIKIMNRRDLRSSIFTGLVLAIQVMFDPRISYVTMIIMLIYFLFNINYKLSKYNILNTCYLMLTAVAIPIGIATLLHAFWIIPTVLYGKNPVSSLGNAYSTTEAVKYLSFAKLEQTISLLQQNWPENIFGKTYFMRWEFLLLPILAFSSLLFVNYSRKNKNSSMNYSLIDNRKILFFALLALIGAFLSKGATDPFGIIYLWLFDHIPGFIMFRDPTKWYPIIALSYSILIPFTILKMHGRLSNMSKFSIFNLQFSNKSKIFSIQNFFVIFICSYLIFLIRPALSGQLNGFFKKTAVPQDYVKLEKFLYNEPGFFRTLWFPSKQHFGFYSNTHPEISARALFNIYDDDKLFRKFSNSEKQLREASIKYVIVPFDSEKEIFLTDRKYDNKIYKETINKLQKVKWLIPVATPGNCGSSTINCGFGKIAAFKIENSKDHFWTNSIQAKINYKYINTTKYVVNIKNAKAGDILVFSETYDKWWTAKQLNNESLGLSNNKYNLYSSFILPEKGNYLLSISYELQKWVDIGSVISFISSGTILGLLLIIEIKRRHNN